MQIPHPKIFKRNKLKKPTKKHKFDITYKNTHLEELMSTEEDIEIEKINNSNTKIISLQNQKEIVYFKLKQQINFLIK